MVQRLFVQDKLASNLSVRLNEAQSHYLAHVMRVRLSDEVLLFNGQDGEWKSVVTQIAKKQVVLNVLQQNRVQKNASDVCLCFAPIKKDCMDLVVQKATELGVGCLSCVITKRTNYTKVNTERMRLLAVEAAEQSERLDVPEIKEPQTLKELVENWDPSRTLYYLSERQNAPHVGNFLPHATFLVGPEGGFDQQEIKLLSECKYAYPVHLGERILRAETACIAAMVLWNECNGWN